jgi:hypothetical protein
MRTPPKFPILSDVLKREFGGVSATMMGVDTLMRRVRQRQGAAIDISHHGAPEASTC